MSLITTTNIAASSINLSSTQNLEGLEIKETVILAIQLLEVT
jgi:hypothetical protein